MDTANAIQTTVAHFSLSTTKETFKSMSSKISTPNPQPPSTCKEPKYHFVMSNRRNQTNEFVVKCYKDGKRHPDGDYFTEDKSDAEGTLRAMNGNK